MTSHNKRGALLIAAVLLECLTANCAQESGGTPCQTAADCTNSTEAQQAGRCAPEVACVQGACHAECLGICNSASAEDNPCQGGICSQPAQIRPGAIIDSFRCTKRIISCTEASDCPIYRPGAGEWSCEAGACAFPGYAAPYN